MKTALWIAAAILLSTTAACSGGVSPDRPTQAEVSNAVSGGGSTFGAAIPRTSVKCVAKLLVDSDISDKGLKAIVDGDSAAAGGKEDQLALQDLTPKFSECVTDGD